MPNKRLERTGGAAALLLASAEGRRPLNRISLGGGSPAHYVLDLNPG
jgi:hypothetical protein